MSSECQWLPDMGLGRACQGGASGPVNRTGKTCCDVAVFTSLYWGEVRLIAGIELGRTRSALKRCAGARVTHGPVSCAIEEGTCPIACARWAPRSQALRRC